MTDFEFNFFFAAGAIRKMSQSLWRVGSMQRRAILRVLEEEIASHRFTCSFCA